MLQSTGHKEPYTTERLNSNQGGPKGWNHSIQVAIIPHDVPFIFSNLKIRQNWLSNKEVGIITFY